MPIFREYPNFEFMINSMENQNSKIGNPSAPPPAAARSNIGKITTDRQVAALVVHASGVSRT